MRKQTDEVCLQCYRDEWAFAKASDRHPMHLGCMQLHFKVVQVVLINVCVDFYIFTSTSNIDSYRHWQALSAMQLSEDNDL